MFSIKLVNQTHLLGLVVGLPGIISVEMLMQILLKLEAIILYGPQKLVFYLPYKMEMILGFL